MTELEGCNSQPIWNFVIWMVYTLFLSLFPYKIDWIRSIFLKKNLRMGDGTIVAHKIRINIDQGIHVKPVIIKDRLWIGAQAVILSGIIIGEQSIIGANAEVTHNVPSHSVVGRVPARIIKTKTGCEVNNG